MMTTRYGIRGPSGASDMKPGRCRSRTAQVFVVSLEADFVFAT
jgi:hypothetical protein